MIPGQTQISVHKLGVAHGAELFSVFGFTKIPLGFGFRRLALFRPDHDLLDQLC